MVLGMFLYVMHILVLLLSLGTQLVVLVVTFACMLPSQLLVYSIQLYSSIDDKYDNIYDIVPCIITLEKIINNSYNHV